LYVVKVDAARKDVVVGPKEASKQSDIRLTNVNWLGQNALNEKAEPVFAKIRSTRPPVEAAVRNGPQGSIVTIIDGEYGVSPGQACVLYDGQGSGARVLGGGFIASAATLCNVI